ncbi:hypothetical protein [Ruminococcus sp. Marseille-P6503]|uniref:hypothetical protein n=1 Tax=Ruminococcus sp. Marseille-P6503 TaxID=2364796 RepID=UPI000F54AAB6|nr:hypothetical protein [Ruminococcus sp. Marseille-P6503]
MARLKKTAALLTAAMIACTAAGCSDTSYTLKADNEEIRAGIYIDYMLNEMSYQISMLYYNEGITEDYFSQEIEGKSFSEYVSEQALKNTKEYAAITKQFEQLELELTSDEMKDINSTVNDAWDNQSELYEKEGISKESLKEVYLCTLKREKLFNYFYGEGGAEEVSADEMQTYINDNYLRYKTISISKSSSEDEETAKAENEENEALRDEYLEMAQGLSFDEFDQVIDAYQEYQEEQSASESGDSSGESSDSAESDESSESGADADSEESSDDTSSVVDASSEEETDSSLTESSDPASDSGESSESDSDTDSSSEEEEDPYPNETMVNFGAYEEEDLESDYGKLLSEIDSLEIGKAAAYENDSAYYIIIRGDVSERTDYAEDNRDSILQEMKSEDFQTKVDAWVEAISFTENEKALRRYTPEAVYDKQNEYYEELNG